MTPDPETLLFTRFRDRGDVAALGELYDRTAIELLRVATHLARDPAQAEDLVQQTFVAAIEAAPRFDAERRVRAWLLGILANLARKLHREQARPAPATEAAPNVDPHDLAASDEFTAQVDAAISTLPEVYQPVLVLHLKHGLIAAEIAHALRRAPGTVRTQLMRALELLKQALPASAALGATFALTPTRGLAAVKTTVLAAGAKHAAAVAAAGVAALGITATASATATATVTAAGGTLVVNKYVVVIALVLVALVAGALSLDRQWADGVPRVDSAPSVVAAPLPAPAPAPAPPPPAAATETERVPVPASPTHGSARYRFEWESDRTPAVGVWVHTMVWGRANPFLGRIDVQTDANGEIALRDLEPGKVGLYVDRAEGLSRDVVAGAEDTATYRIPRGITADVLVQDERDRPIAGASVWLSHYGNGNEGNVVGTTNAAGRCAVRDIGEGRQLAARAAGRAPTPLHEVIGSPGDRIEIVLTMSEPGASLHGLVRGPDGSPRAGARVRISGFTAVRPKDPGKLRGQPPPFDLCTDDAGRFVAIGLPLAEVAVAARATGAGTARARVDVRAGEDNRVELTLPAAARLVGHVRDDAGRPVAGADIGGGAQYGDFGYCSTTSAADGSYVLADLTPGLVQVGAHREPLFLPSRLAVQCAAGEQVQDFVLRRSDSKDRIRGVIVDENDRPLVGWTASLQSTRDDENAWSAWERTDADGRFVAAGCPYAECTLAIFAAGEKVPVYPVVVVPSVKPGGDELRVVVPGAALAFATIRGHVQDAAGGPLRGAEVEVRETGKNRARNWPTDGQGAFVADRLPPRRYELAVRAAGHPVLRLGEHTLAPDQQLDLGTIGLPRGGRLEVRPRGLAPKSWAMATVTTPEGSHAGYFELMPDASATSDLLVEGRYHLRVLGNGIASARYDVEIVDGQTTTLQVDCLPGAMHHFELREPRPKAWQQLDLVVLDAQGKVVHALTGVRRSKDDRDLGLAASLGLGVWRVRATTDTGLAATADVHVTDVTARPPPMVLELR